MSNDGRHMGAVKAVLFDLDGTLLPLDFDGFFQRYLQRICRWYRNAMGLEILQPAMAAAALMLGNDGGRTNADVFWSCTARALGRDRESLEAAYDAFVAREASLLAEGVEADPAARAVVDACRAAGQRIALATNPVFSRSMIDARARWAGLDPGSFDLVTSYDRMRFCKPAPEYYRQVASELGVAPDECLMVGNDVAMDLTPAARVGMRTCLVTSPHVIWANDGFVPDHACALAELRALLTGDAAAAA